MKTTKYYPLAKLVVSSIVLGASYLWGLRPFIFRCFKLFDLTLTGYSLVVFEIVSAFMYFTLVYLVLNIVYQQDKKRIRSGKVVVNKKTKQNFFIALVVSIIQIVIVYMLVY